MEMCPYCGEDLPVDSQRCWKCGTELSGAEGGADGLDLRRKPSGPPAECPFCQADVSPNALRCNDCGRPLRQVKSRANYVPAVYGVFGLVVVAVLVGLLYSFLANRRPPVDPGRENPIDATYAQLARIYLTHAQPERKRQQWEEHHQGKFVRWTSQADEGPVIILRVDEEAGTLALGNTDKDDPTRPKAILELLDPTVISTRGLKAQHGIAYSARLDRYDGQTIYLTAGVLDDEK